MESSSIEFDMFNYAQDVPTPPEYYHFTEQQKVEIDRFFHEKKYLTSPNSHLDLYQAAIVAICKCISVTVEMMFSCISL
jgi:hypothetical protein